jgi:hypothetical protein
MNGAATRAEILARFAEWLDAAMKDEEPPAGIDADILAEVNGEAEESEPDSYKLWAAMTTLTQEVKLQGRAFHELSRSVSEQPGTLSKAWGEAARERERDIENRARTETERRCWKQALEILIDLDDRLARGLETVERSRKRAPDAARAEQPGFLARLLAKPKVERVEEDGDVAAALVKGYELTRARVAQAFEQLNAHRIQCVGEPFDPRTMNAIERQESATAPEGLVLEVYKSGFEWNGEVLRTAQVKVACAPAGFKRDD